MRPHGAAVVLDVRVSLGPLAVPALTTAEQHHVTLCRCGGRKEAGAVATRLQAAAAPWLCEKGILRQQLAKEAWLCRTAHVLEGMQLLRRALREGALQEDLPFEPDERGWHVSL